MSRAFDLLRRAGIAEAEMQDIQEERQHLQEITIGAGLRTGTPIDHMPESKVEQAVLRMSELDAELSETVAEYARTRYEAHKYLQQLTNRRYRRLLHLRYMCGLSWDQIQTRMQYTEPSNMYRAHRRALRALERIMQDATESTKAAQPYPRGRS